MFKKKIRDTPSKSFFQIKYKIAFKNIYSNWIYFIRLGFVKVYYFIMTYAET